MREGGRCERSEEVLLGCPSPTNNSVILSQSKKTAGFQHKFSIINSQISITNRPANQDVITGGWRAPAPTTDFATMTKRLPLEGKLSQNVTDEVAHNKFALYWNKTHSPTLHLIRVASQPTFPSRGRLIYTRKIIKNPILFFRRGLRGRTLFLKKRPPP